MKPSEGCVATYLKILNHGKGKPTMSKALLELCESLKQFELDLKQPFIEKHHLSSVDPARVSVHYNCETLSDALWMALIDAGEDLPHDAVLEPTEYRQKGFRFIVDWDKKLIGVIQPS